MALLSLFSSLFGKSRNVRSIHRRELPSIEILEQRIAPASLINARTVEFTDADGDSVTITASKPIFKAGTVNKILNFDTGSVDGDSSTQQQLQLINISKIKGAGLSITVDSVAAGGGNGFVDVGFVNARNRDIGTVDIDGDLGRFVAGKRTGQTLGTQALIVESIGARGITTQDAGGTLETIVAGGLGQLTVNGDIVGATVNVGGAVGTDRIGQINIAGSLIGGSSTSSGVIRAQGEIGPVTIGGDIRGGAGDDTGQIGSTARVGAVNLGGSIIGGAGLRSGALLSTGELAQVTIEGSIQGGLGVNSGVVGSSSSIIGVAVQGSLLGGGGQGSGAILSVGAIGSVDITGSTLRGLGGESAAIGAGGALGNVAVGGSLESEILAGVSIGQVSVAGAISRAEIRTPGNIGAITANASLAAAFGIRDSVVNSGRDLGSITAGRSISDSVFVAGSYFNGTLTASNAGQSPAGIGFGTLSHTDFAGPSTIGAITVNSQLGDSTTGIVDSSFFASVSGISDPPPSRGSIGAVTTATGIANSYFESGSLGALTVSRGSVASLAYFATDSGLTGTGIGAISVTAPSNMSSAITTSNFVSAQQIGSIEARLLNAGGGEISTPIGAISESNFTAATSIASIFAQAIITPGVDSSKFTAGTGIGNVTATSETNYGFSDTLVRSGGNLGTVSATSTFGGDAIFFSGFNARGSIAGVDATGNISVSAFIAGIDLGADFTVTPINNGEELVLDTPDVRSSAGFASSNLTIQTSAFGMFGFGGTGSEADTVGTGNISIGPVILGGGNDSSSSIQSSTFLGGVTSLGADGFVGTDDDVVLAGARIESITADGTVDSSRFKSAAIGNTQVGGIFSTLYQAVGGAVGEIDAFGGIGSSQIQGSSIGVTTVGNGRISNTNYLSTGTVTGPGIADITVNWSAFGTFGGAAISQSTFTSGTTIANVSATVTGTPFGSTDAISFTGFNAHTTIGDITGRNDSIVPSDFTANALALVTVTSGISGSGGIGNISAIISNDPVRGLGSAIQQGTFDAGSGNIASITATATSSDGIVSAIFRAGGTIGDITVSTSGFASSGSVFSAGTDIGNVKLTGDLRDVRVLAGYDIGTDMVYGNEDLSPTSTALKAGAKVGTVTTVGLFERIDIIASVNPGADYSFGGTDDTIVGTGGSIGLIDITVGRGVFPRADGFGNAGVEATAIADSDPMVPGTQILINGTTYTLALLLGPDGSATRFVAFGDNTGNQNQLS